LNKPNKRYIIQTWATENIYTVENFIPYFIFDPSLCPLGNAKQKIYNIIRSRFWPHLKTAAVGEQHLGYGK
jgi:hypothetical protein